MSLTATKRQRIEELWPEAEAVLKVRKTLGQAVGKYDAIHVVCEMYYERYGGQGCTPSEVRKVMNITLAMLVDAAIEEKDNRKLKSAMRNLVDL